MSWWTQYVHNHFFFFSWSKKIRFYIFEVALDECWSECIRSDRSALPFQVTDPLNGLTTLAEEFLDELMSSSVLEDGTPSNAALSSPPPLAKILSTVSCVTFVAPRCFSRLLLCGFDAPRVCIRDCFRSVTTLSRTCSRAFRVSRRMPILVPRMGVSEMKQTNNQTTKTLRTLVAYLISTQ